MTKFVLILLLNSKRVPVAAYETELECVLAAGQVIKREVVKDWECVRIPGALERFPFPNEN